MKEYGQCGVGAYCLGGCDPASSFSLDACLPAPVCKSATYNFNDLSRLEVNTKYLGDASQADWVYSGTPLPHNGNVLLTLSEGSTGTLLASTHYVWYGKITSRLKTSAGAGVVTAFILLADSKDEIDFEFVGTELEIAQTNFYNQGVPNYTNGANETVSSDVFENYHIYEIDWKPDTITWSIDGNQVRTLNREDTWNATANRYSYPQTPARVQLSIWPAGLPSDAPGTIAWAGGLIQWNSTYMVNGYYYATFDWVSVECYDPPSGANVQGSKSYIYTNAALTNNTVEVTNRDTTLKNFQDSGLDPTAGSAASSTASATKSVSTVPGSNNQPGIVPGQDSSHGGQSDGTTTTTPTPQSTGFVQGNQNAASVDLPKRLGSPLAALAIGFLLALLIL